MIAHHACSHAFNFFRGEHKRAKMIYKNWATDNTWGALDNPITMITNPPSGIPSLVAPSLGGEVPTRIDDLKAKVKASFHRMTEGQVSRRM